MQDNFTPGMARAAAATAMLNRELNSLSGQSLATARSSQTFSRDIERMGNDANGAGSSINQLTGRIRVLAEVAAILGPSLAPLGGVAIAGVAGLANQMGAAAIAGGVLIGSLQGVGDALGAMNKAQLDPTNKNLEAAEDALKRLSPAAREFAEAAFDLKPALVAIRDMGAESLMPGLTESLDSLERLGPKVANIFQALGGAMGDIAADSAASLASDRWADFFEFAATEVPDTITELAAIVGDLTHGMTELWEAFTPLNDDFSSWMMGVAEGFDQWATGLSATDGFQEFIDYIRTTGPQVADTLGALGEALVQIVQASAPLGGPVLAGIEAVAKAVSAIADSDLGTPIMAGVTALALLNRSLAVTAALSKTSLSGGFFGGVGAASSGMKKQAGSMRSDIAAMADSMVVFGSNADKAGAAADRMKQRFATGAGLAGVAVAATGAADAIGLTNTMSLALMGSLGGPPGIALGAAAGALLDMKSAGEGATEAIQGLDAAIQSGDMDVLADQIAAAKAELADITDLDFGGDIFDRIGFQIADTFGGPSMDDARRKIEASEKALRDLEWAEKKTAIEAKGAALAFLQQTGANVDLGKWSRKSAESIKAQADAIIETQDAAKKTAGSFVTLGDSLNDSKTSLGDWIRQMAQSADALINFTRNSRRAAENGLNKGLIASLQDAGEEGALRMRQLANATDGEIGRANAAWRKGQKAMKDYVDYKVPPKVVTADTSRAMQSFREVDTYLSSLDGKTATTYVNTVRSVTGPKGAAAFSQNAWGDVKDRHNPEIAPGGAMRIWAEPETQGESYIPHANDGRRPRAKKILEHTADKFGGQVLWFAKGGSSDGGKKKRRKVGVELEGAEDFGPSEQAQMQAAEALQHAAEAQEQAWYEAEQRAEAEEAAAEHQRNMFLAVIEGQERAAQGLIDAAQEQKQSAEQVRDGWAQAMDRAGSAATSGFSSNLFGDQQRGMWSGGKGSGGSWMDALTGDIAGLQERQGLIAQLSAQGVTGSALEALLGQGNNAQVQELIASGQAGQFAATFAQREALLASTSSMAGQAAYGSQHAAASAAVAAVDAQIQFLQAQLAAISAQRPITVYEAHSAQATAAEVARLQAMQGAA